VDETISEINYGSSQKVKILMAKEKVPRLKRDFRFVSTSYSKARKS